MRLHTSSSRRAVACLLAICLFTIGSPSAQQTGLPTLKEEYPPASETKRLEPEELAAAAKRIAELGLKPDTSQLLDLYITAMTMAFPAAGGALAAAKSVMGMLGFFDKPDPVQEALKLVNARLEALEKDVTYLKTQVETLRNTVFFNRNYQQIQRLLDRHAEVAPLAKELEYLRGRHPLPTDRVTAIAEKAQALSDRFLFDSDRGIWDWSDLRVFTHPETRELVGSYRPADFKPLPTFEFYAATLALWVAAIEYEANGRPEFVRNKYGSPLTKHAAFLSTASDWNALAASYTSSVTEAGWIRRAAAVNADSLPEMISRRVSCQLTSFGTYPDRQGLCGGPIHCTDQIARSRVRVRDAEWSMRDRGVNTGCSATGNEARGDEEEWKRQHGTEAMALLARKLMRLATYGTIRDSLTSTFPGVTQLAHVLYAGKATGEVLSYQHLGVIDTRTQPNPYEEKPRDNVTDAASTPPQAGMAAGRRKIPGIQAPAPPSPVVTKPVDSLVVSRTPVSNHQLLVLGRVQPDWQQYAAVHASGSSGIVGRDGTVVYAVTPSGAVHWYRHEGYRDGSPDWKGPVPVAEGWNRFTKIFSGGNGVLYGVEQDGGLRWMKHLQMQDGTTPAQWSERPVQLPGSNWKIFVNILSSGDGVIYGVLPDGSLIWNRHKGFAAGTPEWEASRPVGTGWQEFTRLFSPGGGVIYAVRPDGQLLWYWHHGHRDGSYAWEGPVALSKDWTGVIYAFPRMASPLAGSDVR